MHDLAVLYGKGYGVTRDNHKSLVWMKLAADAGFPTAKQIWDESSKILPANDINKVIKAAEKCAQENLRNCD